MPKRRRNTTRQSQPRRHRPIDAGDTSDIALDPLAQTTARNILIGTRLRQLGPKVLHDMLEIPLLRKLAKLKKLDDGFIRFDDTELAKQRRTLHRFVKSCCGKLAPLPSAPMPLKQNLEIFARRFGVDEISREIITFVVVGHCHSELGELVELLGDLTLPDCARVVAAAIARPHSEVAQRLNRRSRLYRQGLLGLESQFDSTLFSLVTLRPKIADLLLDPLLDQQRLMDVFVPEAPPPTLSLGDFQQIEGPRDLALKLLRSSLSKATRGINLLFYGPTGTGKSELSRLLAQELAVPLLAVGLGDDDGLPPSPLERLESLQLAQGVVAESKALLLFDEIEDLFRGSTMGLPHYFARASGGISKQWFNLLLEEAPTPTLWISNSLGAIDPAFLRRFSLAIEFKPLGVRQRARVLRHHLGEDPPLSDDEVRDIAERFTGSPAQYGSAVACARLIDDGGQPAKNVIEQILTPTEKIVQQRDPSAAVVFDAAHYDVHAVNTDDDLESIARQLESWRPGRRAGLSMCLYGPPGTGKSEYVRYLARHMGRRVVAKRGSDILSMWVGQTEKNIAQAFDEAEEDDALLLFDEVDSLLRDRQLAERGWQVSQVNEFLQQIEHHRGVVACTTNLWRDIDQAALRRFVLKLEFKPLRAEQALRLFDVYFVQAELCEPLTGKHRQVERRLGQMGNLTPGDFSAVARRCAALGQKPGLRELLERLEGEVAHRRNGGRVIGFTA